MCLVEGLRRFRYSKKVKVAHTRLPQGSELIPVLGSQSAGDVSHKPGGRLPLLSTSPQLPSQPLSSQCYGPNRGRAVLYLIFSIEMLDTRLADNSRFKFMYIKKLNP